MSAELQLALDRTVLGLFQGQNSAFLTTLYCGLKFRWSEYQNPTAWTDGRQLVINPVWFLTLTRRSQVALVAHELWHVAFMHMTRRDNRHPQLWNMAADHAINLMLLDHGYFFDMPCLADPRFTGMSAERIYDILEKENTAVSLPFGDDFGPPQDPDDAVTPEVLEAEISALVVRAATVNDMAKAGNLPGGFTTLIEKLLNPRINWGTLFERWMTAHSEVTSDWSQPSRRSEEFYLPSRSEDNGLAHMVYAVDASYSMTDDQLRVLNSELRGIKENFNPHRMTIISFDDVISQTWEFTENDKLEELTIPGRGGTNMQPVFDYVAKERPEVFVMFSDMECPLPEEIPGVAMLWVCFDHAYWVPPYGDVIHVDSRTPTTA